MLMLDHGFHADLNVLRCNRCRRRKTKCLQGLPCPACELAGVDCVYVEPQEQVTIPKRWGELSYLGPIPFTC